MRVCSLKESFGLENLRVEEREEPAAPGPGQVRLKMRAASLNYRDLLTIQGLYNPRQPLPLIPCSDGVGEVLECGPGVARVRVGERVCPIFAQSWLAGPPERERLRSTLGGPLDGTLAEQMVVPAEAVVRVPDYLSDEQAACLPCAGVTAWSALVSQAGLSAGMSVLLLGTGGVSLFALQIARIMGLRVILTSSSAAKLERARELGARDGVNYREVPEWSRRVRELTGGRGVDLVVEVGGADTLARSLRSVRIGGQISLIGVLSGSEQPLNLLPILMQNVRVQGILVGSRDDFEALVRALEEHRVEPVVDRVFALSETRQALEYLASGAHFGKVCVRVDA